MEEAIHPTDEEMENVYSVMKGESDRGMVLVGAALIEWQMAELLKAIFLARHEKPDADIEGQIRVMLDPNNPKSILGAAAPRARMCRLLGLIDKQFHKLLKEFFIFRNEHFAHGRSEAKLADKKIKKAFEKLIAIVPEGYEHVMKFKHASERDAFSRLIVILYFTLDYRNFDDYQTESQPSSS